jgi:hypothetical protein
MEALASLVEDKNYTDVCQKILDTFGSLKEHSISLQDSQGRVINNN